MKKTLKQLCQEFSQSLIVDVRNDGKQFTKLVDGHPQWMLHAVHVAHGDMMPEDKKYSMIGECLEKLAEQLDDAAEDFDNVDSGEIADSLIDIYNYDRILWLASHLERAYYCDDAQSDGMVDSETSMFDRLGMGQYMEYREILDILKCEIQEQYDEQG